MTNLALTSPHMKGDHVEALQRAMKKHGWLQGNVDGEFGDETARAVFRSKFWLGYKVPNRKAGDILYEYLTGKRHTTPAMQATAKARHSAKPATPIRQQIFQEAQKYIGVHESPFGSNNVMFSRWYGIRGPWCAMFICYCGVMVHSRAFARSRRWSYCPNILDDARRGRNWIAIDYNPQTGDLVLHDFNHDGIPDHVELFGEWTDSAHTQFSGIGGNTGHGSAANGGEVMWTSRNKSTVRAFVHVGA